jgi:hypothetical protein
MDHVIDVARQDPSGAGVYLFALGVVLVLCVWFVIDLMDMD